STERRKSDAPSCRTSALVVSVRVNTMRQIISAEAMKVAALIKKTTWRPTNVAMRPPSAEPMAMVAAVVEADSELVVSNSSAPFVMTGMVARLAALKKDEMEKSAAPTA